MANLEDEITDWLVDYLAGDSDLTGMLNGDISPGTTWGTNPTPHVRVDRLDGEDLMVVGLHRVWVDTVYHVYGVDKWREGGRPDRTVVNAIGARIDALLHDYEESTSSIHVHSFREEPEPTPEVPQPGGGLYLQSGGIYRIRASAV